MLEFQPTHRPALPTSVFRKYLLLVGVPLLISFASLIGLAAAVLSPQDVALYVLDERRVGDFARDFARLYPVASQRRNGIRVVVHNVRGDQLTEFPGEVFRQLEIGEPSTTTDKLFIRLSPPFKSTKKLLRESVENLSTGESRSRLLRRVVPILGVGEDPWQDVCERLVDDWIYSADNFGGIGLVVNDGTLDIVGDCLRSSIQKFAQRDGTD